MALSSLPHGPFAGLGLRRVAAIVGDLSNERWDCADTVPVAQPASLFEPFVSTVARTMKNILWQRLGYSICTYPDLRNAISRAPQA